MKKLLIITSLLVTFGSAAILYSIPKPDDDAIKSADTFYPSGIEGLYKDFLDKYAKASTTKNAAKRQARMIKVKDSLQSMIQIIDQQMAEPNRLITDKDNQRRRFGTSAYWRNAFTIDYEANKAKVIILRFMKAHLKRLENYVNEIRNLQP